MPQMVALLNGFGGAASVLVGGRRAHRGGRASRSTPVTLQLTVATAASGLIGAVTFTGSLVAFAKLQEMISGNPVLFRGQHALNALLALLAWRSAPAWRCGPSTSVALLGAGGGGFGPGRAAGHPHRRRGHAGGDLACSTRTPGMAACATGFVLEQHHADHRRRAGGRLGHHPHADHVQGHEPLAGQRAVRRRGGGGHRAPAPARTTSTPAASSRPRRTRSRWCSSWRARW